MTKIKSGYTMQVSYATAFSEQPLESAIKEISIKIKAVFPKTIPCLFVFATLHYSPGKIIEMISFTINPQHLAMVQTPAIIFEGKIIEQGILAWCIGKESAIIEDIIIKQERGKFLAQPLKVNHPSPFTNKTFLLSFIPRPFNNIDFINEIAKSLPTPYSAIGGGFTKRGSLQNYTITNITGDNGCLAIFGSDIPVSALSVNGFTPIGTPFIITKAIPQKSIIMEINGLPAIDIYKKYFADDYALFKINNLFPLYPLSINQNGKTHIITVTAPFEDGSLLCIGNVTTGDQARFLLFHSPTLINGLPNLLAPIKKSQGGIVFIINSLARKKIIKTIADDEIQTIKNILGEKFTIIGIYCDYTLIEDQTTHSSIQESGNILISLWE